MTCPHSKYGVCPACADALTTRIKQLESVVAVCQESRNKWRDAATKAEADGKRLDWLTEHYAKGDIYFLDGGGSLREIIDQSMNGKHTFTTLPVSPNNGEAH